MHKGTNNILFLTEADWISGKNHVISHVIDMEEFRIFYLNASFYRLSKPGSGRPPEIWRDKAEKIVHLLKSGIFDFLVGDGIDIMILKCVGEEMELPSIPCMMLTLDPQFERFEEAAAQMADSAQADLPWQIAAAPDTCWLYSCKEYYESFVGYGISKKNLAYFPYCTFVQNLMNPSADGHLKRRSKEGSQLVDSVDGNILAVGAFNRDFQTFVEACAGLEKQAHIITDIAFIRSLLGPERWEKLNELLEKTPNVKMHDKVSLEMYIDCIRHARAVVVPLMEDRQITGHYAIADAQRLGSPVVATDYATSRDFIRREDTGLLYRPGDAGDLRQKIKMILDDPKFAERMARRGRKNEKRISLQTKETFLTTIRSAADWKTGK